MTDIESEPGYCRVCGSCGCLGCCNHFCDACREPHDYTADGTDVNGCATCGGRLVLPEPKPDDSKSGLVWLRWCSTCCPESAREEAIS